MMFCDNTRVKMFSGRQLDVEEQINEFLKDENIVFRDLKFHVESGKYQCILVYAEHLKLEKIKLRKGE